MLLKALLSAIHPKVAAAGIAGSAATAILSVLAATGHPAGTDLAALITAGVAFLAGWLKRHNDYPVVGDNQDDGSAAAAK